MRIYHSPWETPGIKREKLSKKIGDCEYYRERVEDFQRRHPGEEPPAYYLNYGARYCRQLSEQLRPMLSEQGQGWLDRTRENLQLKIEQKRLSDPEGFEQLELDSRRFQEFAYGTHPDVYLGSGLDELPPGDWLKIATAPDARDLLNPSGVKQMLLTGAGVAKEWVAEGLVRIRDMDEPAPLKPGQVDFLA